MIVRKPCLWIAVLTGGVLVAATVLRYQWVSAFANNADAETVRFLTGAMLSLLAIVPVTFLVLAFPRRSQSACLCPQCKSNTVVRVREDPIGVELWRCSRCGEIKRWCPGCNQGWLKRTVITGRSQIIYVCDECDSTWLSADSIGRMQAQSFEPYLESLGLVEPWKAITFEREFE